MNKEEKEAKNKAEEEKLRNKTDCEFINTCAFITINQKCDEHCKNRMNEEWLLNSK